MGKTTNGKVRIGGKNLNTSLIIDRLNNIYNISRTSWIGRLTFGC